MRFSRQTPDQVAESCLRNSSYQEAAERARAYRARLQAGDPEAGEATPYGLSAETIYVMEESAARTAAVLQAITGGCFDTAGAIEALRSVARYGELVAMAATALADQAALVAAPAAGEA